MRIDPAHPKQTLLFYISDDLLDEGDVAALRNAVADVANSRAWLTGRPLFVDEQEEDPEAGTLRTVGGFLKLYSALPPWGDRLPNEVDRTHLKK